jgi:hypothetical protein
LSLGPTGLTKILTNSLLKESEALTPYSEEQKITKSADC